MEDFIRSTALPLAEPIPAYGVVHITAAVLGLSLVILLAWLMRKMDHKKADWVLFGISVVMLLAEVYKQFFFYYVVNNKETIFSVPPVYLCSVPMYICLVLPFIKKKKPLLCFLEVFNFLGGFLAFVEPSGILTPLYYNNIIHSYFWHLIIVFMGFYIIFSERGAKTHKDYLSAISVFGILCGAALILNLALYNVSGGRVNALYMGPGRNPLIVFNSIYDNAGVVPCVILYMIAQCLGAYIIFCLINLPSFIKKMKSKKEEKTA